MVVVKSYQYDIYKVRIRTKLCEGPESKDLRRIDNQREVNVGDDRPIFAQGFGTISFNIGLSISITLTCWLIQQLARNLFSVGEFTKGIYFRK